MLLGGWVEILANVGLCAVVVALWTELRPTASRMGPRTRAALLGLVMGAAAAVGMAVPYTVAPGVFFDLRTAMVALAGFFGGPIAGLLAATPALLCRAYAGGAGALPGCLGIAAAAALGCLGHRVRGGRAPGVRDLAALGGCVAVANLLTPLLLPRAVWSTFLPSFGPLLFGAVMGTIMLFGAILLTVQRREDLAATNAMYRAMVEALPESLNVKDPRGRFLAANTATARLMGAAAPEELIGKSDFDFYPPELARRYRADEVAFLADGGGTVVIDQPRAPAGGPGGWLSTLKAPFRDARGRLAGIVTHNRDITERKLNEIALAEARDAATAADRAKSEFLASMSHEMRTPLTAVIGIADLLADRALEAEVQAYVEAIRGSGQQLLSIVNDVLDLSRLGVGQLRLHEEDFALGTLLDEVGATLRPLALDKGLALEIDAPRRDLPPLRGDPMRLRQILFNLVGNAIKFTARGEVRLGCELAEGPEGGIELRVEVRDTGIGIAPDHLRGLFRPFTQVDSSASRGFGGAGLGLAISKQLVELMRGQIGCESAPGVGSRFWFEVTLRRGRPGAPQDSKAAWAHLPPLRILLAEDAPLNRQLLTDMLKRHGHRVAPTEDGAEFLERAGERRFDVLLVDIQMPLLDGEAAIRRLRCQDGPNRTAPAVALTANVMEDDRQRYLGAGFDAVLHKPVAWDRLFAELARLTAPGGVRPPPTEAVGPTAGAAGPAPAVDWAFVAAALEGLPAAEADAFLERALADARAAQDGLRDPALGADARCRLAHRVKGTTRSFGLVGLGGAAEAVERALEDGSNAEPALLGYAAALNETAALLAVGRERRGT